MGPKEWKVRNMTYDIDELIRRAPVVDDLRREREVCWADPLWRPYDSYRADLPLSTGDIDDAEARLARFAPFIRKAFPETEEAQGLIESALTPIPAMQAALNKTFSASITGRLLLKQDSHLPIAGSVKARGGIYEVLKHTEELAMAGGLLRREDDYGILASPECRAYFSGFSIHVGSTGNLGLSIGIMSAAIGYRATVHMSADAKGWKKDLLRARGVQVVEYASDYSRAVEEGRKTAEADPRGYFVDDENSKDLFLGYAVAARRLAAQLRAMNITVDGDHPLLVYIPCGVGGAPGGITFGLKDTFGDDVYCFFVEPVQAPCMLLGLATGLHNDICVQDIGLTGMTQADGLAVGRPSRFVGKTVEHMVSGMFTVSDGKLFDYMRALLRTEHIFIEPSACAAFQGVTALGRMAPFPAGRPLTPERLQNAVHILWATGGAMVPEAERERYINTHCP